MTINDRLEAIRQSMKTNGVDAYIIPSSDPHQSEYVANYWQSRAWSSGFTGSAGTTVITAEKAGVSTDSRYFLQGEEELAGSNYDLLKQQVAHAPEHLLWLKENVKKGGVIGIDGRLFSVGQLNGMKKAFGNHLSFDTSQDYIVDNWKDRPSLPQAAIFEHEVKYSGKSREAKLAEVQAQMQADWHLVSTLDDIAWVLNLRGRDVACNPVFYSYLLVGKEQHTLFIEESKVSDEIKANLAKANVVIKSYDSIITHLQSLNDSIHIDLGSTSVAVYDSLDAKQIVTGKNICRQLKAIKNETEITHLKKTMVKDGVALTRLYKWLETELDERSIPEAEVADKLAGFRKAQGNYFGESFDAIVGYKGNGAIVHYKPEHGKCANIEKSGILLLDSGGQYFDGTTDTTRTIALSPPTMTQKRDYTLVLKGHIALDKAVFPKGTSGVQLDTLARMAMWQYGMNYGHGTGHGVGFFLNVHEPPQGFATNPATSRGTTYIEPGMLTSNEPGFYKNGEYGIRIENLVVCVPHSTTDSGEFYQLESVTIYPMDTTLVNTALMTEQELGWLNSYNRMCYEKLAPELTTEEAAWLKTKCVAIYK